MTTASRRSSATIVTAGKVMAIPHRWKMPSGPSAPSAHGPRNLASTRPKSASSASPPAGISPPVPSPISTKGKVDSKDPIDQVSCRPDFGILCYPVIAFDEKFTHVGSQNNLLGQRRLGRPHQKHVQRKQVTSETPPVLPLAHLRRHRRPPGEQRRLLPRLHQKQSPRRAPRLRKGRHGVGLGKGIAGTENWPTECIAWMKNHGFAK